MKPITTKDILKIKEAVSAKTDRLACINTKVASIRASYKTLTDAKLAEAVVTVRRLEREVEEINRFLKFAEKTVAEFYRPASLVA